MDIRISKESEVTICEQLVRQIVFLIATGSLKPGEALPSIRALATRLKIHHNTVSQAYQHLTSDNWLVRRHGSRMVVRSPEEPMPPPRIKDLDDLINATVRAAQQHGYTLQQLRQRVRERMLAQPPDHILVVEKEPGMRHLLREELQEELVFPVEACTPSELSSNRGLAIGALVVSPPGLIPHFASLLPKDRPPTPVTFCTADDHVKMIRKLRKPSLIAVVSISEVFLQTARGLLAPAVGRRHSMREYFIAGESPDALGAADIVFCDSIAHRQLSRHLEVGKAVPYRLVSPAFVEYVSRLVLTSADKGDVSFSQ
jgi:DNA-binding transcriptional regulator YhcF (GntR family)